VTLAATLTSIILQSWSLMATTNKLNQISQDFDGEVSGNLPMGWSQHQLGEGTTRWAVKESDSGKVFAQLTSKNPSMHFNLAVYDSLQVKDTTLTVRLRRISGKRDQGGGLIWRYLDEQNYYVVRANPLEDNVVMYKMEEGIRTDLPLVDAGRTYGMKVDKLGSSWHTLKLHAIDDEFTVYLDEKELFRVRDKTFTETGHVGLWTKADAVTWFDDFVVQVD
jgi:hypothetical protein